jgi:hypothetical protein
MGLVATSDTETETISPCLKLVQTGLYPFLQFLSSIYAHFNGLLKREVENCGPTTGVFKS